MEKVLGKRVRIVEENNTYYTLDECFGLYYSTINRMFEDLYPLIFDEDTLEDELEVKHQ